MMRGLYRWCFSVFSVILLALALSSIHALAAGHLRLNNESDVVIHPWFKSSCWNPDFGIPADTWVFFGGLYPRGSFQWDNFNDLLTPDCDDVQFTYTTTVVPPVDPVKGNHRTRFTVTPEDNIVLQVGDSVRSLELEGPGEQGR